jgi:hypothetical protein
VKLSEIQQQAIQARISQIVGAENYDRLFVGVVFSEVGAFMRSRQPSALRPT